MELGQFLDAQLAHGITHQPHSILLGKDLDDIIVAVPKFMHDYMHGMFVVGVHNYNVFSHLKFYW